MLTILHFGSKKVSSKRYHLSMRRVLLGGLWLMFTHLAFAAPSFSVASPVIVGTNPVAIATADVNSDGYLDLIVANGLGKRISVLTNNGRAQFEVAMTTILNEAPARLLVADVNGDGLPDVIAAAASF